MTDREKYISLLEEFGIPYKESTAKGGEFAYMRYVEVVNNRAEDKVSGYDGYLFDFYFDDDGNFFKVGIWE